MKSKRLSAIDAFFVAYQESSGVSMLLGVEVELKGRITREDIEEMLLHLVRRWPPLGQRLYKPFFGLEWDGPPLLRGMLHVGETREALHEWRNKALTPFVGPPFQVFWIANGDEHILAFRAHHAVVDGEGFIGICAEALRALAGGKEGTTDYTEKGGFTKRVSVSDAIGNVHKLREQARSNKSARLAVHGCSPGKIGVVERDVKIDGAAP